MPDKWIFFGFYGAVLLVPVMFYLRLHARREKRIREAIAKGVLYSEGPRGQHPHIDVSNCIGCQGCTKVCPEGDVLAMVGGKAAFLKPYKCIGHGLCADACPVGAITIVTAKASLSASLPFLTEDLETSVPNLFIAGELSGLALIKNAVRQGRDCIDLIARRLSEDGTKSPAGVYDVVIVGAGPAGISASLRAIERELSYVTLERETLGGAVAKYPRQKVVMTSPIDFPLNRKLKKMQLSKESLLDFWHTICDHEGFRVQENEPVESIRRQEDGTFTTTTPKAQYRSRAVLLAMGRSGTPNKLGVKGEDLPKVMYRLLEADHYINNNILVVGGGDSAVEAAMGLALQKGNQVTLSYRKDSFSRIKERNAQRLQSATNSKLRIVLNSAPVEFTEQSVILDVGGQREELPNDFVWIFAGGVPPNEFLKKIGIAFGPQDLTLAAVKEAGAGILARQSG